MFNKNLYSIFVSSWDHAELFATNSNLCKLNYFIEQNSWSEILRSTSLGCNRDQNVAIQLICSFLHKYETKDDN